MQCLLLLRVCQDKEGFTHERHEAINKTIMLDKSPMAKARRQKPDGKSPKGVLLGAYPLLRGII